MTGAGDCVQDRFPAPSEACATVDPWALPPAHYSMVRAAMRQRAALVPYLYTLTRDAVDTGVGPSFSGFCFPVLPLVDMSAQHSHVCTRRLPLTDMSAQHSHVCTYMLPLTHLSAPLRELTRVREGACAISESFLENSRQFPSSGICPLPAADWPARQVVPLRPMYFHWPELDQAYRASSYAGCAAAARSNDSEGSDGSDGSHAGAAGGQVRERAAPTTTI
eukprot:7330432-Pyramimonas_sp.AAC.2